MGSYVRYSLVWGPEMSAEKPIKNFWKFISIFFGLWDLAI